MNTRAGLSFRPKACMRCGGDAYLNRSEDIEWVCLQCGRSVPDPRLLVTSDAIAEPALIAIESGASKVAA